MGNCFHKRKKPVISPTPYALPPPGPAGPKECYRKSTHTETRHPLPSPPLVIPTPNQKPETRNLPAPRSEKEILSSPNLKAFMYSELKYATRNFRSDSLLGEGGFGYVYKGWLDEKTLTAAKPGSDMVVAVKKLKPQGFQGHKEWLSEVNYLGKLHHPNLVKLIGFCSEGRNRLLVYELMPRGSLEGHLFRRGARPLSWVLRIKVAIEAARGLCFLHESESQVIYRDFKSSNILLDSEFNAKLSDFGLAKAGPTGNFTHVSTQVMGTEGYTAPEYAATGRLTAKCDVYSFGIVLLELITGRRAIDKKRAGAEENLLEWVTSLISDKQKLFRIMDSKLGGQYHRKSAEVVSSLALRCAFPNPKYRPDMSQVLSILEKLPNPKVPTIPWAAELRKSTRARQRHPKGTPQPELSPVMPRVRSPHAPQGSSFSVSMKSSDNL